MLRDMAVTRTPVPAQVADHIRREILEQRLIPGDLLSERDFCEATGTSRASVREALRRLEHEGLVTSEPGKGVRVTKLTESEAHALYEVRAMLEGFAGRLFTERATEEERVQLQAVVERMRTEGAAPQDLLRLKDQFYDVLFGGARNPVLRQVLMTLQRQVTVLRAKSLSVAGRPQAAIKEMEAILVAVANGDADAASEACTRHVLSAAAMWGQSAGSPS